jgi:hypothetical protein
MTAIFRIIGSILINFLISMIFSLMSISGTLGFNVKGILFFFVLILCTIGILEMRWIHKSFQKSSYIKSFLTLNSLNLFTPILAALLVSITYQISFTIESFFTETVMKWYFINALISGIIAFFFMHKKEKSWISNKHDEVLDEDFLN